MGRSAIRILITRLSHIGDCLHGVPLVHALRESFPDAFLSWAIERPSAPLIDGLDGLDELIVVSRRWLKSPRTVWQLRQRLQQAKFDVVIDPQGLTKSSFLGWLSGARMRIGFSGEQGREISRFLNNCLIEGTADHVVDRYLGLLQPLGITAPQVQFDLPRHPQADQAMAAWLDANGIGPFAVLNPGAGWASKRWPPQRYAAIAQQLAARQHVPSVVVWAGNDEYQLALQIAAEAGNAATVAPRTSLIELAALLRRAQLMVSGDTGPLHLAVAVGTRCVGMYGTTEASKCGPYGHEHLTVQEYYQAGTSRVRRSATNDAMQAISVDRVLAACETQLARGPIYRDVVSSSRSSGYAA